MYKTFKLDNDSLAHEFHVVNDNSQIPGDGIIGADLLMGRAAHIDLEKFELILKSNGRWKKLKIYYPTEPHTITLPPRCEKTYWVKTAHSQPRVFEPHQLCEGVYLAAALTVPTQGKLPIKILNIREHEVKIKWVEPASHPADAYHLLHFRDSTENPQERAKQIFNEVDVKHLNTEEIEEIKAICEKFQDVFHLDHDKLTCTTLGTANIPLKPNARPQYTKPYRLPHSQKPDIIEQITQMENNGIIEPSCSPWNSPVLIVPKKKDPITGLQKFRLVIDYRKVNEQIEDDKFPLPNIADIYDMVGGATYFSCLDLSQGYYQLALDPNDRPITAFSTETGHYQLTRLPMGLKISPNVFSRMMTIAMSGLTYSKCFVYLDDLIVFGKNLQDHNKNLMTVFQRLREVNLKIHPRKCSFLRKEVLYLGHVLSTEGILPDPSKCEVMEKYPVPRTADEVRRFVAFANYYRKFIPNFAEIAIPLNKLLRKHAKFDFSMECQQAFEKLKEILISPKVLRYPDFENEFILRTDASGYAIGAVLSNADDSPIAYASKTLNPAEKNYSTIEKELLAIVWAVKHYRPYLFGRPFKIITDHRPLVYLFSLKEPSSRLTKFRLLLEEYNFTIQYTQGKDNCTADALSRIILNSDDLKQLQVNVITRSATKKAEMESKLQHKPEISDPKALPPNESPNNIVELKIVERLDSTEEEKLLGPSHTLAYVPSKNYLLWKWHSYDTRTPDVKNGSSLQRDVKQICEPLNIRRIIIMKENIKNIIRGRPALKMNNVMKYIYKEFKKENITVLFKENIKIIDDKGKQQHILNDFHLLPTSGHAGINRMIRNITKKYHWPGIYKDVTEFVKHCKTCQRNKHINLKRQPMEITTTAERAWEKIYIDLVGPLPETDNNEKYILSVQDELTKFIEAIPICNKEATTVADGLVKGVILRHGVPSTIASDQGTEFLNEVLRRVCSLLKIRQINSCAYSHQSIGALENTHKTLGAYLRSYVTEKHTDWSSWLPYYVFSYNTSVHSETRYTPFELMYGRQCELPSNIRTGIDVVYNYDDYVTDLKHKLQTAYAETRKALVERKQVRKEFYDTYYKVSPRCYEPGSLVLLKNEARHKLDPIYTGPFEVLEDQGTNCKIIDKNKHTIVHKNRIKPYLIGI